MKIQRCTGEGQGECRKCKMDGIWNRHWMSGLYEIDGMPGVYCWDCVKKIGKEQYIVPYFMSSHPGCTLEDAIKLAEFMKKEGIRPNQVQDFYPTPGTVSTCMFYTGLDPYTMKEVYVAKSPHDKALQRALLQYFLPQNRKLVEEAYRKAGIKRRKK